MEIEKYQSILDKVNQISSSYYEQAKASGEKFNIFEILGMESKENKTHSAFLYALLKPKGNHLQESIFLQLFLKEIGCENFIEIDSAFITVEKHIGFVDNNYENGGRIDLVIEDKKGNAILIENKIYAQDQPNQLQRYFNYGKANAKQFKVLYLTLWGEEPNKETTGNLTTDEIAKNIIAKSYEKNIIGWLNECTKIDRINVSLREAIIQYKNLIFLLTNKSNQNKMEQDIINLIMNSKENFASAQLILSCYNQSKNKIFQQIVKNILQINKSYKKVYFDNYYVTLEIIIESNTEFWFSFKIYNNNHSKQDSNIEQFNDLFKILLEVNKNFKRNDWNFWVTPRNIWKFNELPNDEIFELYNEEYQNKFVTQIYEEGLIYLDALGQISNK